MVNCSPATLDRTFGALADPTRRAILARLTTGEATVGELAEPFDISLPAISKHLKVLEEAGLLASRRQGRTRLCRLQTDGLASAADWIETQRRFWTRSLDALERYLAETDEESEESR